MGCRHIATSKFRDRERCGVRTEKTCILVTVCLRSTLDHPLAHNLHFTYTLLTSIIRVDMDRQYLTLENISILTLAWSNPRSWSVDTSYSDRVQCVKPSLLYGKKVSATRSRMTAVDLSVGSINDAYMTQTSTNATLNVHPKSASHHDCPV